MAFADPGMEERFLSQHRDDTAEHLRWACLVGAAIMIGFLWQDTFISTSGAKASGIRLFGALPVSALAWYLSRNLRARRFISYISALFWLSYACFTAAIFIVYEPGPYGLTSSIGVGSFLLLLFGVFTFSNLRLWASIVVGLLILLVYTASVALWTEADFGDFITGDFLTAVALVIGTATKALFTDRAQRRLFQTSELLRESYAMVEQQVRERTAELQVTNTQLMQAQKLESVGRLAGGVAHDFNNMLGVILGHTELALGQVDPAQPLHGDLEEIQQAAQRSTGLTRQLLAFARKQTIAPKVLDLNESITGMLKMLQRLIGEDIDLRWRPEAGLWPVRVDPSQLDQILANLCVNARDAITDVGKVTIETANGVFDAAYSAARAGFVPGEYVRIAVSDDGCGMDEETLAHIFEPFFTTKSVGTGTGLGLATVYGIVKQNGGFIYVYSEPGQGTTFTIYLPRHAGKAEAARTDGVAEPLARGHETILLVEDERAILEMTKEMLERQGYVVLAAGTPGAAIRLAKAYPGEIHLLMTDVVMPEMNGGDLATNLLALQPHLKRLFMSGYTSDVIAHRGVLHEGVQFIEKPFSMKGLAAKVREALESN
jgi:signal transduction histidine kinase